MDNKYCVSLITLESHNHIVGDIERGVKVYEKGGVEFDGREPNFYWARVPHKGKAKTVTLKFSHDGQDLEYFTCDCTLDYREPPLCRHVAAAVFAIQGDVIESVLEIGQSYWFESCVTEKDTARVIGSGDLEVLATPRLITLMEHAAYTLLEADLEEGQTSVGTNINVSHTAASPVATLIEIEAKITSVRGRTVTFDVSASDGGGEIGKGEHTRVIVDEKKFMEKAHRRISAKG